MEKATVKAKLIAEEKDFADYTTYVFELLDETDINRLNTSYIMCVRYPNWSQDKIVLGQIGILNVMEVTAGKDQYYNGNRMEYYRYSNIQFMKFIPIRKKISSTVTLD